MATPGLFVCDTYGNGNRLVYSRVKFFEREGQQSSHIDIKYVMEGTESYTFDKKQFKVTGGKFLLINAGREYDTTLYSKTDVTGLCLRLDRQIVDEVYNTVTLGSSHLLDNCSFAQPNPLDVYEHIYDDRECVLGAYLKHLATDVQSNRGEQQAGATIYYNLAERLLLSQGLIKQNINRIQAGRFSTKQELYRRLQYAKQIMDDTFNQHITIENVAAEAALSPFHFFRTFKQAFNITPHQYLLKKRLENAMRLLADGKCSIGEIAHMNGFSDIYSFSKSFKKAFQLPPSQFARKQL